MPNGTLVLVHGKTRGIIRAWNVERQAYLVEIEDSMTWYYVAEKYLAK